MIENLSDISRKTRKEKTQRIQSIAYSKHIQFH